MARHIAVVGSGRFARSVCGSLAGRPVPEPVTVTVLARDGGRADQIARAANVRASITGTTVMFAAERLADERAAVRRLRPDVLLCVASEQSPYERTHAPSRWTDLIGRAGFGVTLPLQAGLVARLAGALAAESPDTLLVNGCFPDAVNPLLAALGLPVHCGVGNVATLAACLGATLGRPGVRVLGHHAQLAAPDEPGGPDSEVRAWLGDAPLTGVTELLAADRALPRTELNAIGAHAAARLVTELGAGELRTSLPGPLGLPGGYPVRLPGNEIELDLPAGLSREEAIAWNTAAGRRDGVEVTGGRVGYPDWAAAAVAPYLPDVAAGWPAGALPEVRRRMATLRDELRAAQPVPVGSAG